MIPFKAGSGNRVRWAGVDKSCDTVASLMDHGLGDPAESAWNSSDLHELTLRAADTMQQLTTITKSFYCRAIRN